MADGARGCMFSLAGNDRAAFWSWEWQEAMDTNNLNTARLLRVTTFMALLEIILMMGSCTGLPCSSHKRIPTLRVCSLKHEIPVIRTWFETTAKLRFSHKNARPRDASGSCPATLQWKPSRSAISAWSPQVVFFKATIPGRNTGWFPLGGKQLGLSKSVPQRLNNWPNYLLLRSRLLQCSAVNTNHHFYISGSWVKNLGRALLGASCSLHALTKVTRSAGLVMPGALAGVDRRLDTAENTHQGVYPVLSSLAVSVQPDFSMAAQAPGDQGEAGTPLTR